PPFIGPNSVCKKAVSSTISPSWQCARRSSSADRASWPWTAFSSESAPPSDAARDSNLFVSFLAALQAGHTDGHALHRAGERQLGQRQLARGGRLWRFDRRRTRSAATRRTPQRHGPLLAARACRPPDAYPRRPLARPHLRLSRTARNPAVLPLRPCQRTYRRKRGILRSL